MDGASWVIGGGMLGMLAILHHNASNLSYLPEVAAEPVSRGPVLTRRDFRRPSH